MYRRRVVSINPHQYDVGFTSYKTQHQIPIWDIVGSPPHLRVPCYAEMAHDTVWELSYEMHETATGHMQTGTSFGFSSHVVNHTLNHSIIVSTDAGHSSGYMLDSSPCVLLTLL